MAKRTLTGKPVRATSDRESELEIVRELARIAIEFDLSEVDLRPDGRVRVARGGSGDGGFPRERSAPTSGGLHLMPAPTPEPPSTPARTINSPFVGTFYRAPSPEAPAFAEVGQTVRKGQVVCIVEAMKLMNEIESEFDGKIVEILVKNGQHVEYGQALLRVE